MSKLNSKGKPPLRFILDLYDAFLREADMKKVAAALNLNPITLNTRMCNYPILREVRDLAAERRGDRESFSSYIYKHLSEEARKVWDELQFWEGNDKGCKAIEKILANQTKKIRQELFVHACVHSNFDLSEALRMTGTTRWVLNQWQRDDDQFAKLLEEIQWHKKNFFEHALLDLVEMRHPGAVMFVNRTVNADRGYTEKLEVSHGGQLDVSFSIDQLDLSIECRKEILEAMRRRKEKQTVVDVSTVPPQLPQLTEQAAA